MTCTEARDAFSELYDGLLSGPPLAALSRHLDECDACRAEWQGFRQALLAVSDLGAEDPPPGFVSRVLGRVERPARRRWTLPSFLRPLPSRLPLHAAALALLVLAGWWMVEQGPEEVKRAAETGPPPVLPQPAAVPMPLAPPAKGGVALQPRPVPPPIPSAPRPVPETRADLKPRIVPPSPPAPAAGDRPTAPPLEPAIPARKEKALSEPPGASGRREGAETARRDSVEPSPPIGERRAVAPPAPGAASEPRMMAASPPAAPPAESGKARGAAPALPADERFSAAATAFAGREYARAAEDFQAFLTEQPGDRRVADARFYLAESLYALGRYREAAPVYAAFLAERPDHRHAVAATYRQGLSRLAVKDVAGCALLKHALERAPRAADAAAAKAALVHCP